MNQKSSSYSGKDKAGSTSAMSDRDCQDKDLAHERKILTRSLTEDQVRDGVLKI
jgi:hypothetical protein